MARLWFGNRKNSSHDSSNFQQANTCCQDIRSTTPDNNLVLEETGQPQKKLPSLPRILANATRTQLFASWRQAAFFWANTVLVTLVINSAVVVWAHMHANFESGLAELYRGDCNRAKSLDTWVHLAINVISTLLLSGSNYTMQVLVGPSRQEVDLAHSRGRWLDIGVPSIRNLRNIASWRVLLWTALGLSSIPLHLMFNSAFYSALPSNDYYVMVVKEQFLEGADATMSVSETNQWGTLIPQATINQLQDASKNFDRLSNAACLNAYGTDIMDTRRNLIIVASDSIFAPSPLLWSRKVIFTGTAQGDSWICEDPGFLLAIDERNATGGSIANCLSHLPQLIQNATAWSPGGYHAKYCLSERAAANCTFNANIPIIIIVLACNFIKAVAMFCTVVFLKCEPLLVVGDAIQSFLNYPDNTTIGLSLLSRADLKDHGYVWPSKGRRVPAPPPPIQFFPVPDEPTPGTLASAKPEKWTHAPSRRRWIVNIATMAACLLMVIIFFILAVSALNNKSWSSLWRLGFGRVHIEALVSGGDWLPNHFNDPSAQITAAILMANIPQLVLSFFYVNINGILTTIFLADEWSDFIVHRKTLRVSSPKGSQRSTYFLQLPYKIAIPLIVTSILLHWLVSQSIFLAVISSWSPTGTLNNVVSIATCGFSPMPMMAILLVGVIVVVILVVLGTRFHNPLIPLASSCSAAISAACHSPYSDVDAAFKPLQWGVVSDFGDGDKAPHCCFSSEPVGMPENGKVYH